MVENGLDATHTEFVHPSAGLQGSFDPADMVKTMLGFELEDRPVNGLR